VRIFKNISAEDFDPIRIYGLREDGKGMIGSAAPSDELICPSAITYRAHLVVGPIAAIPKEAFGVKTKLVVSCSVDELPAACIVLAFPDGEIILYISEILQR
jgi:hypothetical protein